MKKHLKPKPLRVEEKYIHSIPSDYNSSSICGKEQVGTTTVVDLVARVFIKTKSIRIRPDKKTLYYVKCWGYSY